MALVAFVLLGDHADQILRARGVGALDEYSKWDAYSGWALVALVLFFLAGIFRAALKRSWQEVVLFVVFTPLAFGAVVAFRRLG